MNIWDNFIYFYHLDKFCILPSTPDTITDSMTSTYRDTNALARSAPVQSYIQSGPRTITFNISLHRDIMEDLNTDVSNLKDNVVDFADEDYVDVLINYLQARALPKYNVYKVGSKVVDPPQVAIKMGNDIFIRGVVSGSVSVTYKKPILDNGKYATADITIPVTEIDPYDAPTVVMKGGFRGVTSTFKNGIFKGEEDSIAYNGQEYTSITTSTEQTTVKTTNSISKARAENAAYNSGVRDSSLTQRKTPSQSTNIFSDLRDWIKGSFEGFDTGSGEPPTVPATTGPGIDLFLNPSKYGHDVGVVPLQDAAYVTKAFNWPSHKGVDLGWYAENNCKIIAWQDGTLIDYGLGVKGSGIGNYVVLEHVYKDTNTKRWSVYIHLKETPNKNIWRVGWKYTMGEPIAATLGLGAMRRSGTGDGGVIVYAEHLHFYLTKEMPASTTYRWQTMLDNCIDPVPYLYSNPKYNTVFVSSSWKKMPDKPKDQTSVKQTSISNQLIETSNTYGGDASSIAGNNGYTSSSSYLDTINNAIKLRGTP